MRRIVLSALVATMAIGNFAFTAAGPEGLEPHLTDIAGDANFLNGQGFEPGVQESGPMQFPGADLQAITFETTKDGLKVHVTNDTSLDDASPQIVHRVTGDIGGCPMMIAVENEIVDGIGAYWRFTDSAACGYPAADESATGVADYRDGVTVESTDFGFTITLDPKTVPAFAAKLLKNGTKITGVGAHTRTILVAATAPVVDELVDDSFAGYTIGD